MSRRSLKQHGELGKAPKPAATNTRASRRKEEEQRFQRILEKAECQFLDIGQRANAVQLEDPTDSSSVAFRKSIRNVDADLLAVRLGSVPSKGAVRPDDDSRVPDRILSLLRAPTLNSSDVSGLARLFHLAGESRTASRRTLETVQPSLTRLVAPLSAAK